jgi:DNA-binding XRE family transcriptional regulator
MQEVGDQGAAKLMTIGRVPSSSGIYWVSGACKLRGGRELESVFRVDTDSGGSLLAAYWWIEGRWFEQNSPDALLRKRRTSLGYTQVELADLIGSSQSRVAKMETGDPRVSVDRLIRALLALGINRKQVGRAIGARSCVRRHTRTAD